MILLIILIYFLQIDIFLIFNRINIPKSTVSKFILEDQQDFKQKLLSFLDYPSFEPYQTIKEAPSTNELNTFFKKNLDLLPTELQILYGQRPIQKQLNDMYVDQEDTKRFEKELNQKSKYFDNVIVQDLLNRTKQI